MWFSHATECCSMSSPLRFLQNCLLVWWYTLAIASSASISGSGEEPMSPAEGIGPGDVGPMHDHAHVVTDRGISEADYQSPSANTNATGIQFLMSAPKTGQARLGSGHDGTPPPSSSTASANLSGLAAATEDTEPSESSSGLAAPRPQAIRRLLVSLPSKIRLAHARQLDLQEDCSQVAGAPPWPQVVVADGCPFRYRCHRNTSFVPAVWWQAELLSQRGHLAHCQLRDGDNGVRRRGRCLEIVYKTLRLVKKRHQPQRMSPFRYRAVVADVAVGFRCVAELPRS